MSDKEQIAKIISSMKGLAGSGNVLSYLVDKIDGLVATMEPGDFADSQGGNVSAVPIASDLWYLFYHDNLLKKYYIDETDADFNHFKYAPYLAANLSFLNALTGIKPLKALADLSQLEVEEGFGSIIPNEYTNNGIYWINTMAFEFWSEGKSMRYASDGPARFKTEPQSINDYIGYLAFPIGQLGVMEVVSLLQETALSGYKFTAVDNSGFYWEKAAPTLTDEEKPSLQDTPQMFPDGMNTSGNLLAGQNYCFGRHLIEGAYLVPTVPTPSQNVTNSRGTIAYAPTPSQDVELFASKLFADNADAYPEDVAPKFWMRYWIHKDSTLPVPGEFIGILCRPVVLPPHVWWFQESSPFLYAGNWMETGNLTSGVITAVKLEAARTDGGTGNEYTVKVQGCSVIVYPTDFYDYKVGDRVAILKKDSTVAPITEAQIEESQKSFTWLKQTHLKKADEAVKKSNYLIFPASFYKVKH